MFRLGSSLSLMKPQLNIHFAGVFEEENEEENS